jgi:hypothetical protein
MRCTADEEGSRMIAHRTFAATHLLNWVGQGGLKTLEELRVEAERFIADTVAEGELVAIAETRDQYASTVTVWYTRR